MKDLTKINNQELENEWQYCSKMIAEYCQLSWKCPKNEEQNYRTIMNEWVKKQNEVQKEITRRSK